MFGFKKQLHAQQLHILNEIIARQDTQIDELYHRLLWQASKDNVIPYQPCPICEGMGRVQSTDYNNLGLVTCPCCEGAMIIPMHVVVENVGTPIKNIPNDL